MGTHESDSVHNNTDYDTVFRFMEMDFPDDGGGHHCNMLECSSTVGEFWNHYMCMVLEQFLDAVDIYSLVF
jgi:hypothetical protein